MYFYRKIIDDLKLDTHKTISGNVGKLNTVPWSRVSPNGKGS